MNAPPLAPSPLGAGPLAPSRTDPYQNPELFRWTGSMEGVPDWIESGEPAAAPLLPARWRTAAHRFLEAAAAVLPGLGIALALAFTGQSAADRVGAALFGAERSPLSPILLAIVFGLAIRNTVGLPAVYDAGLLFALRRVLRVGVALLGIRLSLSGLASVGLFALPIVVGCIATALLAVGWIGRAIGVPRRLAVLVAVGTAICGNTAIVATGPVIGAEQRELSYAVGCITLFGLLALLVYPFLSHALFGGDAKLAGLFLGTAIHDTAQVAGAGLLYLQQYGDATALETATVTKLVRNLFMVAVIPLLALRFRAAGDARPALRARVALGQVVPWFVLGFIAMALARSLGDLVLRSAAWPGAIAAISQLSAGCLAVAMAAVGLGTDVGQLRALGYRPLAVGFAAALVVGAASALLIHALRGLSLV